MHAGLLTLPFAAATALFAPISGRMIGSRSEQTAVGQEQTVIMFAGPFPFVWVAGDFSEAVQVWARERGPMTLLVPAAAALPDQARARIGRFLAILARQTE